MTDRQTFVIVGAGLAGAKTAEALRGEGFDGRIVLLGEEVERPYDRPPLSKDYLQGRSEKEKIYVHPAGFYPEHDIDWQPGTRVTAIDPAAHRVSRAHGDLIGYDKLLLATGASPRQLPVPGADPHRVFTLRRVEDCEQLKATWKSASRVTIVGAGWIGLEVAAAARAAGLHVTVLETATLPLLRVLGPELAEVFARLHREHGVDLRLGVHVTEITGEDPRRATGVRLADGSHVDADLVVVGVGAVPNTTLAEAAGLEVDNGIVVDEHLRSSDPDIYAAGDVANAYHPTLGKHIRVEHWANALNQPATAAKAMLGGDAGYDRIPYFYSDQYQLGMEYSGYVEPDGYDEVVIRGDKDGLVFVAFWCKDRRVLAGMNVNVWDVTDAVQSLIRSAQQIDPARLADPQTPLTDVAPTPVSGSVRPQR
jgi:3-phenylpropionate/trans-cinnamate dioxygenase ferredoxin reductase subunit